MTDRAPGSLFVPRDNEDAETLLATVDHAGLPMAGPMGVFDPDGRELWAFRQDWTSDAYGRIAELFERRAARAHAEVQGMAAESLLRFGKAPAIGPFPGDTDQLER